MRLFVIITSFKEEATIGKAVEQIICPNKDLWLRLSLLITSPDEPTLKKAEEVCQRVGFDNYRLLKDAGEGKASALNLAVKTITNYYPVSPKGDLLILTDGDMSVANDAIKNLLNCLKDDLGGVGGHPVSLDSRTTMFGYFSRLFCEAAHKRRLVDPTVPMSGYLYAFRLIDGIFPIPSQVRAEDAYISQKLFSQGYSYGYAPDALAYVKFPKNLSDWYKQKTRSLGGNVQLKSLNRSVEIVAGSDGSSGSSLNTPSKTQTAGHVKDRSVLQDLQMVFFPIAFAKTPKELFWSLLLYPLRLFLWLKIYFNHAFNRYKSGMWERIESSK